MKHIVALTLFLFAFALIVGGAVLVAAGGSSAYLLIGAGLGACALQCSIGRAEARWTYAALLFATVGWAWYTTGGDAWALIPRLIMLAVVGGLLLVPRLPKGQDRASRVVLAAVCVLAIGLPFGQLAIQLETTVEPESLIVSAVPAGETEEWSTYGGDVQGTRYSTLSQLTPANVGGLREVWRYSLGEVNKLGKGGLQVTPLQIGDGLYLCSSFNDIVALDAETGEVRWRHNSEVDREGVLNGVCRGVAYYRIKDADDHCAERIITNTVDARLIAVDRIDGRLCANFGAGGEVSLLRSMGQKDKGYYYPTSAPLVFEDKIIVGGWVTDNQYWGEPSGVIRAFEATTGAFLWALDVGNLGEHGQPEERQTYTLSSPNSWAPMSADPETGLIFAPIGNPTPDYFGGQRRPFDETFGSSVIAIDADSGKLYWKFQTTHHDLWDYDVASQPTIADIETADGLRKAVIQPTKRGEIFVLDRMTGQPIREVRELAVPQGGIVNGERLSATQPFSVGMPSMGGQALTEERMWGLTPLDQLWCQIRFRKARYDGPLTPPGLTPTITSPGYLGGSNWGSATFDPGSSTLVVNVSHVPNYTRIVPRAEADRAGVSAAKPGAEGVFSYLPQEGLPFAAQTGPFLSPLGIPCTQPPYGEIAGIDMKAGRLIWKRPLGTARSSGVGGIKLGIPVELGTPNVGGPITTAGGLTFIGASQDASLRAFETRSGRLLWKADLPAGGQATPMTYRSQRSGRQFVVIAAGGNAWLRSKLGDEIVAFALPEHE